MGIETKTKHTPGPWKCEWLDDFNNFAIDASVEHDGLTTYVRLAHVSPLYWQYPDDGERQANATANARLIAAAPELLEALRDLVERLRVLGMGMGGDLESASVEDRLWEKATAAIAKATGEPV